jgi:hypothetical protein
MDANLVLEVMTHPNGQHGFDILDSDDRSREIIARTIEVLRSAFGASEESTVGSALWPHVPGQPA